MATEGITMAVTLEAGDAAPDFALQDQDGNEHKLADYRGKTVVLYFYPKDGTAGCTAEACSFRDEYAPIEAAGAVVLGVSTDDAASHRAFRDEHGLPFPLLVDEGAKVATTYGAWGEGTSASGRTYIGMARSTFIIGPDGKLQKVWPRFAAQDAGESVRQALAELKG
jgi:peroxiredoxin Q/BCP